MKKILLILTLFLSSCYIYEGTTTQTNTHSCELMDRGQACLSDHSCCKDDSEEVSYWRTNYSTAGLYYYNDIPYWGYYSGYYYYYGYRHTYPWWYYYNFTPPYYYGITTHVHCHIGNSGYVYRPRGNWRHNNRTNLTYHHDKVHTTGVNVKNKSNVPTKFRNTKVNVTRNNKTNVKTNINKTNVKPVLYIPVSTNRNNVKTNTNKSNVKTNINRNNRSNTNKININRQNKSNTRTNSNRRPK